MAKQTTQPNVNMAVAYIRVSKDEQHLGPEAQRASIEAWATRQGITITSWHVDQGVSGGAPIEKRPAMLAAIDAVVDTHAGQLVVAKRDRLARDVVAAAMIERLVARSGARVVSTAGEGTDGDEPSNQLMRTMVDAFSQYERALIRARTKAALAVKAERGELTGNAPYGAQVSSDGVHLEPCPSELAVIARVKAMRADDRSFNWISRLFASEGIVGRSGRAYSPQQLHQMAAA